MKGRQKAFKCLNKSSQWKELWFILMKTKNIIIKINVSLKTPAKNNNNNNINVEDKKFQIFKTLLSFLENALILRSN